MKKTGVQKEKEPVLFYPKNKMQWRKWLEKHHRLHTAVWVVFYKKASGKATISWSDAVDEALCFGWIDSKKVSIDAESSKQFFTRRKPNGGWSKINKDKVERLIAAGLMTEEGYKCITVAKQNGAWNKLDEVESLTIPAELEKAFRKRKGLQDKFRLLSRSVQKIFLHRLLSAKTPATKQKRVDEIIAHIAGLEKKG